MTTKKRGQTRKWHTAKLLFYCRRVVENGRESNMPHCHAKNRIFQIKARENVMRRLLLIPFPIISNHYTVILTSEHTNTAGVSGREGSKKKSILG